MPRKAALRVCKICEEQDVPLENCYVPTGQSRLTHLNNAPQHPHVLRKDWHDKSVKERFFRTLTDAEWQTLRNIRQDPSTLSGQVEPYRILTDEGVFRERPYQSEQELERLAVAHSKEVFGEGSFYFDLKQKVTSRLRPRITDGLLLDFKDRKHPKFWIVEYELSSHDFEGVVAPQLRGFMRALKDEGTLRDLGNTIYENMRSDQGKLKKFRELSGEDSDLHYVIDMILHQEPSVLVVIDDAPDEVTEVFFQEVAGDPALIVFRTFGMDGRLVHLVNPVLSELVE